MVLKTHALLAALAIRALAITPQPARAADDSARIGHADPNLATDRGRAILDLRIVRTGHQRCDRTNNRFAGNVRREQPRCRADVTATAYRQRRDRSAPALSTR